MVGGASGSTNWLLYFGYELYSFFFFISVAQYSQKTCSNVNSWLGMFDLTKNNQAIFKVDQTGQARLVLAGI